MSLSTKDSKICDKADYSLAALKLIANWFVTSKMFKEHFTALYADENILCFNEDYGNVVFPCNKVGILNIDLKNISLDNNFDEDDPDTIILIRLLAWHFRKTQSTEKKVSEELMPIACILKTDRTFACENIKKKEPIFTDNF